MLTSHLKKKETNSLTSKPQKQESHGQQKYMAHSKLKKTPFFSFTLYQARIRVGRGKLGT